jgi:membrane-bound serine protease (ClpP class)
MKGGHRLRDRRLLYLVITYFILLVLFPNNHVSGKNDLVYYATIDSEVTNGLTEYLNRAIRTAEENDAEAIIFEIHTPGGVVTAAQDIARLLGNTNIKTIAFINQNALSAGAYISLNMDEIYMVPSGKIGAAGVITQDGNAADKKAQSAWIAAMRSAAEQGGRDPIYAVAMADESIEIPELGKEKGEFLTLTATDAKKVGYAEGIVSSKEELLQILGLQHANVETIDKTISERIAEFITNPIITSLLLTLGSLGIVLELYSPGFGIPGTVGISSFLLFFYGHYIAGLAGYESLILFLLGVGLILLEFFIPGGIVGFIGLGFVILSILLTGESMLQMGISLGIAILVAIIVMVIFMKFFRKKVRIFDNLVLRDATSSDKGYVSNKSRTDLLNKEGTALTPLRPSGTIIIDNERIDAVTEGGFINSGDKVVVIKVEGVRVVVRQVN